MLRDDHNASFKNFCRERVSSGNTAQPRKIHSMRRALLVLDKWHFVSISALWLIKKTYGFAHRRLITRSNTTPLTMVAARRIYASVV